MCRWVIKMTTSDDDDVRICAICTKPVLAGQARYGPTGNHYHCQVPHAGKSVQELMDEGDAIMQRARKALDHLSELVDGRVTKPMPAKTVRFSTPSKKYDVDDL